MHFTKVKLHIFNKLIYLIEDVNNSLLNDKIIFTTLNALSII